MKKKYVHPLMTIVAIEDVRLLSGSPDPKDLDANPLYPVL